MNERTPEQIDVMARDPVAEMLTAQRRPACRACGEPADAHKIPNFDVHDGGVQVCDGYEPPVWVEVGALIRTRREALGMSQETLADLVGVRDQTVAGVESGLMLFPLRDIETYARALGVGPLDLLPARWGRR